jgi:hypothetical protein
MVVLQDEPIFKGREHMDMLPDAQIINPEGKQAQLQRIQKSYKAVGYTVARVVASALLCGASSMISTNLRRL